MYKLSSAAKVTTRNHEDQAVRELVQRASPSKLRMASEPVLLLRHSGGSPNMAKPWVRRDALLGGAREQRLYSTGVLAL